MLSNKEIARRFDLLAKVMELKNENAFKIKSYQNAYRTLRKWEQPLAESSRVEIEAIPGVGKNIADKIEELIKTGQLQTLNNYQADIPDGVVELLEVPGVGPKKALVIWQELGIESPGELLYACNENRLIQAKGFGAKTQTEMAERLEFYFAHQGKLRRPAAELLASEFVAFFEKQGLSVVVLGEIARLCPVINEIVCLASALPQLWPPGYTDQNQTSDFCSAQTEGGMQVTVHLEKSAIRGTQLVQLTGPNDFVAALGTLPASATELEFWAAKKLDFVPPALRDLHLKPVGKLIDETDIRHLIHNHSTWSDGLHTMAEMATEAQKMGVESLTISDHSRSAGYAGGLSIERVLQQWREIDALNAGFASGFRVLKGIESDILTDGSLDYPDEILSGFDIVIASIHGNLRMDEATATKRLLRAIENPHTNILGHPTGRLLLARAGYPIDHKLIIDACAANGVAVELNANPARLDIDFTWIPYATQRGVPIAINPDAHSREGLHDERWGVQTAQKGGLATENCINCWSLERLLQFCRKA